MAGFLDHLVAEIQALERSLENDPRFIKLRELQDVRALYETGPEAAATDSPAIREAQERSRRRPTPRTMTPETKAVVNAATEYVRGRSTPVPLRDLYHQITNVRGIPIGGKAPINNLSAMLWRYGFEAVGRAGWRLREANESATAAAEQTDLEDGEPHRAGFDLPKPNGAAPEIHGAATL